MDTLKSNKASTMVIVITTIITLAIIAGGVYWFLIREDEFKDWKTYRNEEHGFEIKYPKEWEVAEIDNLIVLRNLNRPSKGPGDIDGDIFISILEKSEFPWGLREYDKNLSPIDVYINTFGNQFSDRKVIKKDVIINDTKALRVTVTTPTLPDWISEDLLFDTNSKIISISNGAVYLPDFDKILSTFKFIELNKDTIFKFEDVKVGDKIAEMTIKSIKPYSKNFPLTEWNASIEFSGETTITGTYHYYSNKEPFVSDLVCFDNLDIESQNKIPRMQIDTRNIWFCFNNQELARNEFEPKDSSGKSTIVIDEYTINSAETETINTAKLIRIQHSK